MENEIILLQEENTALALRNAELEDIIANGDSTDDDNEKVIVCHKEKKSLRISENALQAHLNHGDTEGQCDDTEISPKNVVKNQIKELKQEFKIAQKELKKEFKEQEYLEEQNQEVEDDWSK